MSDRRRDLSLVTLCAEDDIAGFQEAVRHLLAERVPPHEVVFKVEGREDDLFAAPPRGEVPRSQAQISLPRAAVGLAKTALHHADPGRFSLVYSFLYRVLDDRDLADNPADEDTARLRQMEKAVARDAHKMHAFVRFRRVGDEADGKERFAAWFEPEHHIVVREAPFFIRRFANMNWMIVTPRRSVKWEDGRLEAGPGGRREDVPGNDDFEAAWRAYYASIFNPARVKFGAMTAEMPKRYWRNLPEAQEIAGLVEDAPRRVEEMVATARRAEERAAHKAGARMAPGGAPPPQALGTIAAAIRACTDCPLYGPATQAVPGEGPEGARLFLIGEQPGDREDLEGRPFVGPAGQLLDRALAAAGIDRDQAYVTNAVKHFNFTVRGKKRLHRTPPLQHVDTCARWLTAEHKRVAPKVTVTLGATALRGFLGRTIPLAQVRGSVIPLEEGGVLVPTFHPAYILRLADEGARRVEEGKFGADLRRAAEALAK